MAYYPHTSEEIEEMLSSLGYESIEELFEDIPKEARFNDESLLNEGTSELEVSKLMKELSEKNKTVDDYICFMGGGAYDRYIPSTVDHVISRPEFYTAYTPYQPEVSQGTLQHIYEYQTMICRLTGMDVANASMYDGASALAEAVIMAMNVSRKNKIVVPKSLNPYWLRVVKTYLLGSDAEFVMVEEKNGEIDYCDLEDKIDDDVAAVLTQYPNSFGIVENLKEIKDKFTSKKTMFVVMADPIALGLLKKPGDLGADIVVGEGQQLGIPLSFGGPYLGYFAFRKKYVRKSPGRIIGKTEDKEGKRGFVMTYQTREQHIRREKATSNICTNQGLMTVAASVYMSTLGKQGLREVAEQSYKKAHYLFNELTRIDGIKKAYPDKPFFDEFVIEVNTDLNKLKYKMKKEGYLPGIILKHQYPEKDNQLLIAVTEKRTKEEMDSFVSKIKTILKG
ncbi:MAG: aminomethyl-transferring glycine dehydrogenase subunit GcvPA [Candidatus Mcinerneyibacterium aminivorans]|uniref:Probable glycine dehydrogenase (decarboxylating) subunit 1 n=1 Tax=Candidatus Mcinerneyibacterium aminivorans TaxID=2703815 RepID=A0A5D0MIF7_9BACT|nr:MAG: aminomethyl-transferring glycine dehydrogenase subunit GcvPA [Candidatus Mcinerneyibacterium aminivorans]